MKQKSDYTILILLVIVLIGIALTLCKRNETINYIDSTIDYNTVNLHDNRL